MYCLGCRSHFTPSNTEYRRTNNNMLHALATCPCGRMCSQFTTQQKARRREIRKKQPLLRGGTINDFEFKLKPITTSEVNQLLRDVSGFLGTFAKDQIPQMKPGSSVVVNLHDAYQPGSHWVCSYIDKQGTMAYFFDSYGLPPPENLLKKMKEVTSNIYYNPITYQAIDSLLCGYFCCMWIREMAKADADGILTDWEVQKILNMFSYDPYENEELVKKYFY